MNTSGDAAEQVVRLSLEGIPKTHHRNPYWNVAQTARMVRFLHLRFESALLCLWHGRAGFCLCCRNSEVVPHSV